MPDDVNSKLEKRKALISEKFDLLEEERKSLLEQGRQMNEKLAEIRAEMLRLQGSYNEVESMLDEGAEKKK